MQIPIIFAVLLFAIHSALIPLDKQLVPVSDLTTFTFSALISGKIHDFTIQAYKSAGQ
jgi:threonine/homoserine efflux transporter RhtA